jgi:hypothetical protein
VPVLIDTVTLALTESEMELPAMKEGMLPMPPEPNPILGEQVQVKNEFGVLLLNLIPLTGFPLQNV